VIRPRLVGDPEDMPALLTFVALFGGVELMGLAGLIVGPVLMSLALAALRIYEGEAMRLRERPPPWYDHGPISSDSIGALPS
jgi:predicted PurR-regulated permease PerM